MTCAPGKLLPPCSPRPNCVCSQNETRRHAVAPLPLAGRMPIQALAFLTRIVSSLPGGRVVGQTENYLHCEFTSRWLRFVDDVDFAVDQAAGVVHVRSAARTGWWDFGVNRRRVEKIRRLYSARD